MAIFVIKFINLLNRLLLIFSIPLVFNLSQALEKGLVKTQGIDSDIDYIKRNR